MLYAPQAQLHQCGQLRIVDAKAADFLRIVDLAFFDAATRHCTDDKVLGAGALFDCAAVLAKTEVIGNDEAIDDRFTQPPRCLNDDFIGTGHRVAGKQHAGAIGKNHFLQGNCGARFFADAEPGTISERALGMAGIPHRLNGLDDAVETDAVELGGVLAGKAGDVGIFADARGPHRKRFRLVAQECLQRLTRRRVVVDDGLDKFHRQRPARRDRQPAAQRRAQLHRLAAENSLVFGDAKFDRRSHDRMVTSPLSASTRTIAPSAMVWVATWQPTTPGRPYSRATIAACDINPPRSVTIAPTSGST